MAGDPGLTQALTISVSGIIMLLMITLTLGPVVDEFVYESAKWEMSQPWSGQTMMSLMVFAEWFYGIIGIMAISFVIWPFIYLFKRHKYMSTEEGELASYYYQ